MLEEPTASGAVWVCGGAFSMHAVTHVARWHGSNILFRPHTTVVSLHGDGYGSCCWTTAKTNGSVGAPDVVVLFSTPYLVTNSLHNKTPAVRHHATKAARGGVYDVRCHAHVRHDDEPRVQGVEQASLRVEERIGSGHLPVPNERRWRCSQTSSCSCLL